MWENSKKKKAMENVKSGGYITRALLEEAKQSHNTGRWELFPPRSVDFSRLYVPGAPVWVLMSGKPFAKAVVIGMTTDESNFPGRVLVQYKDNTQYHCRPRRICRIYGLPFPEGNKTFTSILTSTSTNTLNTLPSLKIEESSSTDITDYSLYKRNDDTFDSECKKIETTRTTMSMDQSSSCTIVVCPETSHYRQLARLLPLPGEKVLEIGSDLGACTNLLRRSVTSDEALGRAVGVDKSPKSVEEAKKRFPGIPFYCLDVLTSQNENNLGIPEEIAEGGFDVIFVDINGNRMIDSVAKVVSITRASFSPRLIVCKSTQMTSALTTALEEK